MSQLASTIGPLDPTTRASSLVEATNFGGLYLKGFTCHTKYLKIFYIGKHFTFENILPIIGLALNVIRQIADPDL